MDLFTHSPDAVSIARRTPAMPVTSGRVALHSLLGNQPATKALKSGQISSALVTFDYFELKVANTQCRRRRITSRTCSCPRRLSAATTRYFCNAEKRPLTAPELNGARVGVRAYTQTTGAWVRGFLAEDYGIDLDSVRWVTFEDPHLSEYRDPPIVERAPAGKVLKQMLLDGEID